MKMTSVKKQAGQALQQISDHLKLEIIPFWIKNGIDHKYGGYLTCFDQDGKPTDDTDKYIVTQTRMIWGFSALARLCKDDQYIDLAKQGVDFFIKHFWDNQYGGWFWKTEQNGRLIDNGKVVYGEVFVIYALCEYYLASKDNRGLDYSMKTFDLLQKYCADTANGGYYENLEPNWSISEPGFNAGDRKSLDIHMHLMEAFTLLAQATDEEIHKRKLAESIDILINKMINKKSGCGLNQFDIQFNSIPAINIRRTWNAERETGEVIEAPLDSTSYGHNLELVWLLNRAGEVLGYPDNTYNELAKKIVDHALQYGYDHELGGVYRDGPHDGPALVRDKEWWQNCEVMVGFLGAYEKLGDQRCFDAFMKTWTFNNKYMINHDVGEWRQLLSKTGDVLVGDIGNPWKAFYHSGRSMMECTTRLQRLQADG